MMNIIEAWEDIERKNKQNAIDAARYRWLRSQVADENSKWCFYQVSGDQYPDLDGAIDEAMKADSESN
jgi:hypothetical protein